MNKYTTKPVEVEAIQFDGWNWKECAQFYAKKRLDFKQETSCLEKLPVVVSRGTDTAYIGDYIVKGLNGNIYVCNKAIFESTHEIMK